jgi:hypothetical protein
MAHVTATFEIRNDRDETHEGSEQDATGHHQVHGEVEVSEQRRREITATRELTDAADAAWAIEATEYEVVWDLWEHVNGEDYDGWGFRSPYPSADISVSFGVDVSLHDVVWHICQEEDAEPPGIYLGLMHNARIYDQDAAFSATNRVKGLMQYLTVLGVDTSDWTHGRDSLGGMARRQFPDAMLDHAGYEDE